MKSWPKLKLGKVQVGSNIASSKYGMKKKTDSRNNLSRYNIINIK